MKEFLKKLFGTSKEEEAKPVEQEKADDKPSEPEKTPAALISFPLGEPTFVSATRPKPTKKQEITQFRFLDHDYEVTEKWTNIFAHFIVLNTHKVMPHKEWYDELATLVDDLGREAFVEKGILWIKDCIEKSKANKERYKKLGIAASNISIENAINHKNQGQVIPEWMKKVYGRDTFTGSFFKMQEYAYLNNFQNYFYHSLGGRILRGFLHAAIPIRDSRLIELIDQFAATNPNDSQDAIFIYSQLEKEVSVPKLTFLKSRVKNKNVLSRINKALKEIGKKEGLSQEEVEESMVSTFKLNLEGKLVQNIGEYKAVFECLNIKKAETYYLNKDDKKQKTLPKVLKENFAPEVAAFKRECKEIKKVLGGQKRRIESFYYTDRAIAYPDWKKNYIQHPLVKILAKDLIWSFQNGKKQSVGIWNGSAMVDIAGQTIKPLGAKTQVRLWHPIGFSAEQVVAWRDFLMQNERLQAFKQAFREVYIITDAELNTVSYSNRFASHILKKDHVSALCKARGWSAGIINDGMAKIKIPNTDYAAQYWVSDVHLGEFSKIYGSAHISTDQVRFYKRKTQIDLMDVPAMIFSEVMRDVDLFVGVTSIGSDPTWQDRGDAGTQYYWSNYSFGILSESAKTRSQILKNIVPKMKIAEQCSFDGKYLYVQGKLRKYKIHMGSGNILMEPNDQYLCIVADRSPSRMGKVFIPFEGDSMLSIIISKALLLADDTKIEDPTIVRQITSS